MGTQNGMAEKLQEENKTLKKQLDAENKEYLDFCYKAGYEIGKRELELDTYKKALELACETIIWLGGDCSAWCEDITEMDSWKLNDEELRQKLCRYYMKKAKEGKK